MVVWLLLSCFGPSLAECDLACEEQRSACTEDAHACYCQEWAVCRVECDPGRSAPGDCE